MDIRDRKIVWRDTDVFDIPESVGITGSRDFIVVLRDKLIEQLNYLTIASQLIPDLQKEASILKAYIDGYGHTEDKRKFDKWTTDLITKTNELDHIRAKKEILLISINALQVIMRSIEWESE